jgi:large subunit ribosomal protein L19e
LKKSSSQKNKSNSKENVVEMNLKVQKRIAAEILKCSPKRVTFDTESLDEIKEAITKEDLRGLISSGAIAKKSAKGVSCAEEKRKAAKCRLNKGKDRSKTPFKRILDEQGKAAERVPSGIKSSRSY